MRITDRYNGPDLDQSATTQDLLYRFNVPCTTTPGDSTVGSSCSITTTANTIVGGAGTVAANRRAIWELGQVDVIDGGPDGNVSTTPNTVFARQGIFIP